MDDNRSVYRFYSRFEGRKYYLAQNRRDNAKNKDNAGIFTYSDWLEWGEFWDLNFEEISGLEVMRRSGALDMFQYLGIEG